MAGHIGQFPFKNKNRSLNGHWPANVDKDQGWPASVDNDRGWPANVLVSKHSWQPCGRSRAL